MFFEIPNKHTLSHLFVNVMLGVCACTFACSGLVGCAASSKVMQQQSNVRAASINVRLGLEYLNRDDITRARPKLLLAIEQAPDWPPALNAMGYFSEKIGEPARAEQYYLRALQNPVDLSATRNNYGTFLCRNHRYSEALKQLQLAYADETYPKRAEAAENAGICAMQIPDNQLAVQYFKKALLQNPQSVTAAQMLIQLNKGL